MRSSPKRLIFASAAARSGFTLIELIAVIVVLAVLAGIALPVYFDYRDEAADSASAASLGGIRTALNGAFTDHRMTNAPSSNWIASITDIAGSMQEQQLPDGVTIVSGQLELPNNDLYDFTAETLTEPARLTLDTGGGGGGATSPSLIAILLAGWLGRRRARQAKLESLAPGCDHA